MEESALSITPTVGIPVTAPEERGAEAGEKARWEDVEALRGLFGRTQVQQLLSYLGDSDPLVRWRAGLVLGEAGTYLRQRARLGVPSWDRRLPELTYSSVLVALRDGLKDPSPIRRAACADALALWEHEAAVAFLIGALQDVEPTVRVSVVAALGMVRDRSATKALVRALDDLSMWVRRASCDALGAIGDSQAAPAIARVAETDQPLVRAAAVNALAHLPSTVSRGALERCLDDQDLIVRWSAVRALGRIGSLRVVPRLRHLRDEGDQILGRSLQQLVGEAIRDIEHRERGLWSLLLNWAHRLWGRVALVTRPSSRA